MHSYLHDSSINLCIVKIMNIRMVNYKMVKDLITKWGSINAHTSSQGDENKREEGRGEQETDGVLRNVGGSTEGGGTKSKNQIK